MRETVWSVLSQFLDWEIGSRNTWKDINPKINEGLVWLVGGMVEYPKLALMILGFMLQIDGKISASCVGHLAGENRWRFLTIRCV